MTVIQMSMEGLPRKFWSFLIYISYFSGSQTIPLQPLPTHRRLPCPLTTLSRYQALLFVSDIYGFFAGMVFACVTPLSPTSQRLTKILEMTYLSSRSADWRR